MTKNNFLWLSVARFMQKQAVSWAKIVNSIYYVLYTRLIPHFKDYSAFYETDLFHIPSTSDTIAMFSLFLGLSRIIPENITETISFFITVLFLSLPSRFHFSFSIISQRQPRNQINRQTARHAATLFSHI